MLSLCENFHSQILSSTYIFDARHKGIHFIDSIRMVENADHAIALIITRFARCLHLHKIRNSIKMFALAIQNNSLRR